MRKTNKLPPAVLALIGLSFALGACEYVVVAILPDIAAGLGTDLGAAGSWSACSPPGTPSERLS